MDFDDVEAYSRIISKLEKNKEMRAEIGSSARKSIVNNLQWEQTLTNVSYLYQNAISVFKKRTALERNASFNISPKLNSEWSEASLKDWIEKRELLILIRLLNSEGESRTACKLANSFLWKNFFDKEIWNLYVSYSSVFQTLRRIRNKMQRIYNAVVNKTTKNINKI